LLIHGYMSDAWTNWMKFVPTARTIADVGYHVVMPDLRAHGASDRPQDPAAYPHEVLADDMRGLVRALEWADYDLVGYSLGAITAAQMLVAGERPGRAVLSGMGLSGLTHREARTAHFRNVFENLGRHERGSAAFMAEAFLKTSGGDAVALHLLLNSFASVDADALAAIDLPVGVVCGVDDHDNGSAPELAAHLRHGTYFEVPGNHMSAVTRPELGAAIVAALKP
jgi:pimeloyl-ACP methyl ester carboxylesterase